MHSPPSRLSTCQSNHGTRSQDIQASVGPLFELTSDQLVDSGVDQPQKKRRKNHADCDVHHLGPENVYLLYDQNNEGRDVPPSSEVLTFAIV
jgi:hypothetical protein